MTQKEIEKQLLKLDSRSRARIAKRLLHSLDSLSDEDNERLWAEEAHRRHQEILTKKAKLRPSDEVLREARLRLRR
jgi:hypothetical protein